MAVFHEASQLGHNNGPWTRTPREVRHTTDMNIYLLMTIWPSCYHRRQTTSSVSGKRMTMMSVRSYLGKRRCSLRCNIVAAPLLLVLLLCMNPVAKASIQDPILLNVRRIFISLDLEPASSHEQTLTLLELESAIINEVTASLTNQGLRGISVLPWGNGEGIQAPGSLVVRVRASINRPSRVSGEVEADPVLAIAFYLLRDDRGPPSIVANPYMPRALAIPKGGHGRARLQELLQQVFQPLVQSVRQPPN